MIRVLISLFFASLLLTGCVIEQCAEPGHRDHYNRDNSYQDNDYHDNGHYDNDRYYEATDLIFIIDYRNNNNNGKRCPDGHAYNGYCYLDRDDYNRAVRDRNWEKHIHELREKNRNQRVWNESNRNNDGDHSQVTHNERERIMDRDMHDDDHNRDDEHMGNRPQEFNPRRPEERPATTGNLPHGIHMTPRPDEKPVPAFGNTDDNNRNDDRKHDKKNDDDKNDGNKGDNKNKNDNSNEDNKENNNDKHGVDKRWRARSSGE